MNEKDLISLTEARERLLIPYLDERLDYYRTKFCDDLRYDNRESSKGLKTRTLAWRLGDTEFLVNYYEVAAVPGSATYRLRMQPYKPGGAGDQWVDLPSRGDFEGQLRKAKTSKGYTPGDIKAQKNQDIHFGEKPDNLIIEGLTGSKAYKLDHNGYHDPNTGIWVPPSDTDTRGVFALPTTEVLKFGKKKVLVERKSEDTKYDEIERFVEICLRGNPERLEMLSAPKTFETPEGKLISDNLDMFITKDKVMGAYCGYSQRQLHLINRKEDRTTKPPMHLIRLMLSGIHILKTGRVKCDMSDYREELTAIRRGEMPLSDVFKWHQELEIEFAKAADATKLPNKPDMERINKILLEVRRIYLKWD